MPRQPKQFEVGGIYHVLNRGVDKRDIFMNNQDYSRFILGLYHFNDENPTDIWTDLLSPQKEAQKKRNPTTIRAFDKKDRKQIIELLAFALMPNHYHLIIKEIKKGGVIDFMRKLGGYSTYFNKQHNRMGVLFQGRYKSVPVKDDRQLMTVFNYVHTNPVALKEPQWKNFKVKNHKTALQWLEDYKWSSYNDYIGNPIFPEVTSRRFFMEYYGGEEHCKQVINDWVGFKAQNAELGSEIIE